MCLALLLSKSATAKFSPDIPFESVRTAHFRVHYPLTYRRFAAYLTSYLEEAYGVLSQELHWEPRDPADVVVRGDNDVANGFSTSFPDNRMEVNAVPFPAFSEIGEYDNWIRTLAFHELTHLIANDTTSGFFDFARGIFGSAAKVNGYQPSWLIEGLAVYEETEKSTYGRGRSAFLDMVFRTASRDSLLVSGPVGDPLVGVSLDRLNDGIPLWPGGSAAYFYGYLMTELMADVGGASAPGNLSLASSRHFPYFINTVAQESLGKDYYGLWDLGIARLKMIADADLRSIRAQPVSGIAPLTAIGRLTRSPAPSEDGKRVYFIRDSYDSGPGISVVDLATRKVRDISEWRWGGGRQLRSKGNWLLYSRYDYPEEYSFYSDVYLWDVSENREIQLTNGARAQDADFSPDFRWGPRGLESGAIVYVKNLDDANQALVLWNGTAERTLYRGEAFERISNPAWGKGPAKDWIAFSLKVNGANERLMAVNPGTGAISGLTRVARPELRVHEQTPAWSENGDLLFTSSIGGVFNIYRVAWPEVNRALLGTLPAAKATGTRLTNLETGAFYPFVMRSADGGQKLLASVYGGRGFDLAEVSFEGEQKPSFALRTVHEKLREGQRPAGPAVKLEKADLEIDSPDPADATLEAHPEGVPESYSAFPALWPKYWLPFAQMVTDGWVLGVSTTGTDALEIHHYSALLGWDSRATFPAYDFEYIYDGLYPSIQLGRQQENSYLLGTSNLVDTTGLTFAYPIGFWTVGFGGTYRESHFYDQAANSGGLQARISHVTLHGYPDSIDTDGGEIGHLLDLIMTGYIFGDGQFASIEGRWEQRFPLFPKQSFLRFVVNGVVANNPSLSALYFVGGGEREAGIARYQDYLLRGYPAGVIYGRDLATLNLEYWCPFMEVFHANGTLPAFYERAKLRFFVDAGSGEFVANQNNGFSTWPVGVGVQLLQDLKLFYNFPVTVGLGFDWGLNTALGGEKQVVFGLYSR